MDKAPDAYRTISEVAEDLDLPQHVLRFWETRFSQIKPLKRGGGRRYYRPDDVELLKGIRHLLYKEGYTIKGVQRILKDQGARAVQAFVRDTLTPAMVTPAMVTPAMMSPAIVAPQAAALPGHERVTAFTPPLDEVVDDEDAHTRHPDEMRPDQSPDQAIPAEMVAAAPAVENDDEPAEETRAPLPVFQTPGFTSPGFPSPGSASPVPPPSSAPAQPPARGQVSMFRGGLQRGDGPVPTMPLTEFSDRIGTRVENPPARTTPEIAGRETLVLALEELVACRARIDQILARRQG